MRNKREIGITLVSLVITIIILLILAAISINSITGDNGIFQKAQISKEKYKNASIAEQELINSINIESSYRDASYAELLSRIETLESELEYKPGDVATYSSKFSIPGFITSGKKGLRGTLLLDKKISSSVNSITISSKNFEVRCEGKYLITGSASSSATNYDFGQYFIAAPRKGSNAIYFQHDAETAYDVTTNNIPISILLENLVITFH